MLSLSGGFAGGSHDITPFPTTLVSRADALWGCDAQWGPGGIRGMQHVLLAIVAIWSPLLPRSRGSISSELGERPHGQDGNSAAAAAR